MCFVCKISSEMAKLCFSDIRKWFHAKLLLRRRHQSWSRSWELKSFFQALQFPQMLPADDWQQCGLTDLPDLHSHSHTVCTGTIATPDFLQKWCRLAIEKNQDSVKGLLLFFKACRRQVDELRKNQHCPRLFFSFNSLWLHDMRTSWWSLHLQDSKIPQFLKMLPRHQPQKNWSRNQPRIWP